jgi:hypothetical protein
MLVTRCCLQITQVLFFQLNTILALSTNIYREQENMIIYILLLPLGHISNMNLSHRECLSPGQESPHGSYLRTRGLHRMNRPSNSWSEEEISSWLGVISLTTGISWIITIIELFRITRWVISIEYQLHHLHRIDLGCSCRTCMFPFRTSVSKFSELI